jgi:hypothetical protein
MDATAKVKHTSDAYDYFVEASDRSGVEKLREATPTFICINNDYPRARSYLRPILRQRFGEVAL